MRVEIIQHNSDEIRFRKMQVDQVPHTKGEIHSGALMGDLDMSPSQQRRKEQKQVADAIAFVLLIVTGQLARLRRKGPPFFHNQLLAAFIKTD